MLKQTLTILSGLIIVSLFVSLWGFYFAIRPFRILSEHTPKDFKIPFEEVSFSAQDGVKLQGWFIPSPNPKAKTIILLHGYPADKGDILPSRLFLHRKYNLFFFDFRYFGKSGGSYTTIGKNEVDDLLAAIKYLHSRGINEVGVWGFSFGGSIALMTAPRAPEIRAIVAEASFARLDWMSYEYYRIPIFRYFLGELTRFWGYVFLHYDIKKISPVLAAAQLKIPILLIHSQQDHVISFKHALALQKALHHNPHLQVLFTEDTLHGEPVNDYKRIVQAFFDKYLNNTSKR